MKYKNKFRNYIPCNKTAENIDVFSNDTSSLAKKLRRFEECFTQSSALTAAPITSSVDINNNACDTATFQAKDDI